MVLVEAKVKVASRFYVECPNCNAEFDVDLYEAGEQECVCDQKFSYDNRIPENAETV